jgi:hypothetical protein
VTEPKGWPGITRNAIGLRKNALTPVRRHGMVNPRQPPIVRRRQRVGFARPCVKAPPTWLVLLSASAVARNDVAA